MSHSFMHELSMIRNQLKMEQIDINFDEFDMQKFNEDQNNVIKEI